MKLTDFDKNPIENATRALKEHYNVPFNVRKMSYAQARDMLTRVRGLMSETKKYKDFYEIKHSKYFSYEKNFDFNLSSFKLYKPKLEVEMTDRLKNEVSTGYVSFL